VSEQFFIHELPNGMTLLAQPMENVSSAAATFVLPAGSSRDPEAIAGAAAVAAEWLLRGAGDRNSRQLIDALDALGCQHSQAVRSEYLLFSAAQLGRNLAAVLEICADILRRPRLEDQTFPPCRDLTAQDLAALEDEPGQKCHVLLTERFYPAPLGRCAYGTEASLAAMTPQALRRHVLAHLTPAGTILSVAGRVDCRSLRDQAERLFGDWEPRAPAAAAPHPQAPSVTHVRKETAQAHIGLAHRSATFSSRHYYPARMAEAVLSVGMSSRLFTEVREKRGLVYHVSSHYHSLKEHAGMFTYAGTRPEAAQETLEVTVGELRRLGDGVTPEELARARTQLKSSLIMQGESTSARSGAMAVDWYHLRRLRTLQEISEATDRVSAADVAAYLEEYPARDFTILTIGPAELRTSAVAGG